MQRHEVRGHVSAVILVAMETAEYGESFPHLIFSLLLVKRKCMHWRTAKEMSTQNVRSCTSKKNMKWADRYRCSSQ